MIITSIFPPEVRTCLGGILVACHDGHDDDDHLDKIPMCTKHKLVFHLLVFITSTMIMMMVLMMMVTITRGEISGVKAAVSGGTASQLYSL